ncbi:hypothetical protein [Carnobacterium iners]|uniref:hypothetical protein n=1 Tax=Carnobacterium iners TaxID=1073423 RepID=UPI000AE8FC7B|nr:hypothetical protein [Carnobacterium iners]
MGDIQSISLGVIGEYLSRVFIKIKNRPIYFIQEHSEKEQAKELLNNQDEVLHRSMYKQKRSENE